MTFLLTIEELDGKRAVEIEDNGSTVYAYLLEDDEIVSDVWLYNSAPAASPRWDNPAELPFANKPEYIRDDDDYRIEDDSSVTCEWDRAGAKIYVDGILTARLQDGAKPGWSRLVRVNSPLGLRLSEAPE